MLHRYTGRKMVSVYALKPGFQNLLRPAVRVLARAGITANSITLAAVAGSVLAGIAAAQGAWAWLPLWLPLRMALNAMDGMLAREHGQASRVGAWLNEAGDLVADAALTMPLAWTIGLPSALAMVIAAWAVEWASMGDVRRWHGPFGKSDRAVFLGVSGAWLALGFSLPAATLPVWLVLCAGTIWNRRRS
jgi:CDP-diacylglycerol---glycerol-3-phosphate 3-phosphatidyltransferase